MPETLRGVILEHYRKHPERLYARCILPDGEVVSITYGGLVSRGSQFALEFRQFSAEPGDIVVIILPHSPDLFCAFIGAVLGGQVPSILAVPSFKLNPTHYREELQALLGRIDARVLVTDSATASHLGIEESRLGGARVLLADKFPVSVAKIPDPSLGSKDLVLLQHSSGSTGLKKGVALSNRAVLEQIWDYAPVLSLDARDQIVSWLPLYHDMGLIACTVLPVVVGIPVTALSPLHWVTKPVSMLQAISKYRCTMAWMPNFAYEFLASRVRPSQLENLRLDSMRAWINCAEPTLAGSHRQFLEKYEKYGVRSDTLWTCYAMAETVFAVSQSSDAAPPKIESIDRERFQADNQAVPVEGDGVPSLEMMSGGAMLSGVQVKVVDKDFNSLPERSVGEIAIRSGYLFSGYFRDPSSTARVLQDEWFHSGDMGYLADSHLFITGRKKDLIIIAGKNYYPQDIERIVCSVPGIYPGRSVALGLDDPAIGTQRLIVLAEVQDMNLVDDPGLAAEVRNTLAGELDCVIDDLKLLPHMWLLKTSSGKIARAPNLKHYLEMFRPDILA
ncbi:MAG: AMP-binding protein [bacterium]|jgi:acyl-CoA synthetase (AMP-forming)/AMP-acid ligase II